MHDLPPHPFCVLPMGCNHRKDSQYHLIRTIRSHTAGNATLLHETLLLLQRNRLHLFHCWWTCLKRLSLLFSELERERIQESKWSQQGRLGAIERVGEKVGERMERGGPVHSPIPMGCSSHSVVHIYIPLGCISPYLENICAHGTHRHTLVFFQLE